MNDKFEDRLWDALKHEAERPGHELPADRFRVRLARRAVTARRASLGLAAAAAVGTVLAVVPGGGTPAHAVTKNPDGTVTLRLNEVVPDRALQKPLIAKLRAAGIHVVVDTVPAGKVCAEDRGHAVNNLWKPTRDRSGRVAVLEPGDTLALTYSRPNTPSFGTVSLFSGPVSKCRLVDGGWTTGGTFPSSQLKLRPARHS